MKNIIATTFAALSLSACMTPPSDPAQLAAWNAEKTARTEARRPDGGRVSTGEMSSFDALKKEFPKDDYEKSNWQ